MKRLYAYVSVIAALVLTLGCAGVPSVQPTPPGPAPAQAPAGPERDNATLAGASDNASEAVQTETEAPAALEGVFTQGAAASEQGYRRLSVDDGLALSDPGSAEKISLNFDDADIYEVINALSEFLGINYIIDPAVKGKVTIHTSGELAKAQLLPILETIFDMNNIAMVRFGDFYKIVPVKEAKSELMEISIGKELPKLASYDRLLLHIIPLQYVQAGDVAKLLKRFISKGGDIIDYDEGNFLIMVETAATIKKLLALVRVIDTDTFDYTNVRFFKINNADVKEVAGELEDVFAAAGIGKPSKKKQGGGVSFIPIERVSSILVVSAIPGVFEKVENWLKILDTVDYEAEEQVFIYFVENGKADEIADVLKDVYGEGRSERTTRTTSSRRRTTRTPKTSTKRALSPTTIEGKIKIVTDEATNSIIVRATPHDYSIIKSTMLTLDVIPKQVLIEVLIAEVTLSGDTEFGLEWALRGDSASLGGYKGTDRTSIDYGLASEAVSGFAYSFTSDRLLAFLRAQAGKNKLNILSSPHVLAADNQEARIEVGEEVPIITSEYVPREQEVNSTTSRSIEYRSTGVILTVKPRINEKGLVAMEVSQEVSEAQPVVTGGIQSPVITNRKAETSLVVQHGQTVIIGGLIRDRSDSTVRGVPFLSSIPLLSYLFSHTKTSLNKTELVILITPHVMNNFTEADLVTREFKDKLDQVRALIRKGGETWIESYK